MKVFLGGSCNGSKWRDVFLNDEKSKKLDIEYFDPVVKDWNKEAQEREVVERETCDFCLYVITPLMKGVYSIAEVVEDSIKRSNKTIFCVLDNDNVQFDSFQSKSLKQVGEMVKNNGAQYFEDLDIVLSFLYNQK